MLFTVISAQINVFTRARPLLSCGLLSFGGRSGTDEFSFPSLQCALLVNMSAGGNVVLMPVISDNEACG